MVCITKNKLVKLTLFKNKFEVKKKVILESNSTYKNKN